MWAMWAVKSNKANVGRLQKKSKMANQWAKTKKLLAMWAVNGDVTANECDYAN